MPPLWALYTFGGLLLVALLLAIVLLATRASRAARVAGMTVAGADAPLLPPTPGAAPATWSGGAPSEPVSAAEAPPATSGLTDTIVSDMLGDASAPVEPAVVPVLAMESAPGAGPAIVPVLDADETSEEPASEEPHESDSL